MRWRGSVEDPPVYWQEVEDNLLGVFQKKPEVFKKITNKSFSFKSCTEFERLRPFL